MQIAQFRYGRDNLAYLLYEEQQALAIDGGAAEEIADFVNRNGLRLAGITNTHLHGDHTCGNLRLHELSGAQVLDKGFIGEKKGIKLGEGFVEVLDTPGHTEDSVCLYANGMLVSGDTLFNGTVGNCFSGDMGAFFDSIKKLMALPKETKIYAGHDYVQDSLAFAARLEPGNEAIEDFRRKYDPSLVVSSLADEFAINPFLRFNEQSIVDLLTGRGMKRATEFERWESLMWIE